MRKIPDFPNYSITKDGKIWSHKNNKWLALNKSSNEYLTVGLSNNNGCFTKAVHKLVLEIYVEKRPKNMVCRHLDGDKTNNKLSNLCWDTRHENELDKIRHGRALIGERHHQAKLTEEEVKLIFNTYHNGTYMQKELARYFGVKPTTISKIACKKNWRHLWI